MNENRLIDIETRIAYQEDTIQQLNDVVTKQQRQIDRLEDLAKLLTQRYQSLQSTESNNNIVDEKPPHY
ncbi:MAG: SlyX family protein [Gammaproteobacteria bacterium]|nr:SlyX family protein [Gammaproteobacteria bacterium]